MAGIFSRRAAITMPGDDLVAVGDQHKAVKAVGGGQGLHGVGDQLPGGQGVVHAPVAHDDAVAHADGRHHHRGAPGGVDTGFHRLCQLIQMGMSGDDVALGGYHADQGLLQLLVREARGVKQGPVRRPGQGPLSLDR